MASYTYIQIIYGIILLILTVIVGILYWKQGHKSAKEGFQAVKQGSAYIFYHIYCNEKTEAVVKDQITKIIFSEAYALIKTVYCFLTGEAENIETIKSLLSKYGSKFIVAAFNRAVGQTTHCACGWQPTTAAKAAHITKRCTSFQDSWATPWDTRTLGQS